MLDLQTFLQVLIVPLEKGKWRKKGEIQPQMAVRKDDEIKKFTIDGI
jgi:hypothetical protein